MARLIVRLPALHAGQREVRDFPARFKVLSCGRRWGKTMLGACLCTEKGLHGGRAWWVAPTYQVGRRGWRILTHFAKRIPGTTIHRGLGAIEFPGGGVVEVKSADNPDSLRGEGLDLAVLDEAAFMRESAWRESLRPALSDRQGGAMFISTPKGRNWFYRMYQKGAKRDTGWASWQLPTASNPFIPAGEVEAAREDLPAWVFEQEYEAKFVAFAGRVYTTFDPVGRHIFMPGEESASFIDHWGGIDFGFRNPFAAVVAGETKDGALDCRAEVYKPKLGIEKKIAEIQALQRQYGVRRWFADPEDPAAIHDMQMAGLPVFPCPRAEGPTESWIINGIALVQARLQADPPLIRFNAVTCQDTVDTLDRYHYPDEKEGARILEVPVKVDDHLPDAVRYLVAGLEDWHQGAGQMGRAAGVRESYRL